MYIDPNTGGTLFNILAVVLATGSGMLMFFSRNIREAIAKMRRKSRKDEDTSAPQQEK